MARLWLDDTRPEFGFERTEGGDVELDIRAGGVTVHIDVGRRYDDVSLLAVSLGHLAEDVTEQILDRWDDVPHDVPDGATTGQAPV
jgi:hypothetical protein